MNRETILTLLHGLGVRPSTIAYILKVDRSVITRAMQGRGTRRARVKIAQKIGLPPSVLWGDVASRSQNLIDNDVYFYPKIYEGVDVQFKPKAVLVDRLQAIIDNDKLLNPELYSLPDIKGGSTF